MATEDLSTCIYRVIRYTPNLVRDEFINIGVILISPAERRARVRLIEEPAEFARIRRLHPSADEDVLRTIQRDLEAQFAAHEQGPEAFLAKLDETLSNVVQLSPQRAVLTADFDSELDRIFHDHVEAPRYRLRATAESNSRHGIRLRIGEVFRSAGILPRVERSVRVDEFTFRGDPLRLDFAYARNGSRGFVHALALGRDPSQAKVLAYTAERIRAKQAASDFTAVTEVEPQPGNERHAFVASLLADQKVELVPLVRLPEFANRLRPELH